MKKLPVTIRQADHHNARLLSELAIEFQVAAFGHSFRADDLTAHLAQHLSVEKIAQMLKEDVFLVAETGDRMAGFVQFGREYSNTDEAVRYDCELRRLYVHAAFQNRGICGRLMETALGHPTMRHAAQITLDVWEHNPAARRFYARFGFEVIGAREFVVESGAETSLDLIMARREGAYREAG